MPKRKALSKRTRFEIFKRDLFTCQYCGNNPPTVILQVDHIVPVSKGGENAEENLTTACLDCNQGKGSAILSVHPTSLAEKHDLIKEKEEQLKEYAKVLKQKKKREDREFDQIDELFDEIGCLTIQDENTIRTQFLPRLVVSEVEEAMRLAIAKHGHNPNRTWKYFCGICWRKIKRNAGEE